MKEKNMITFEEIEKHIQKAHDYWNLPNELYAWNFCCEHTGCDVCNRYVNQV